MKIQKQFTFSDVGTGAIHLAYITANAPTEITARLVNVSEFNNDSTTVNLNFIPFSGSALNIQSKIGNTTTYPAGGYSYPLHHANDDVDSVGMFTTQNGELTVELDPLDSNPTAGSIILIVEVTTFTIS